MIDRLADILSPVGATTLIGSQTFWLMLLLFYPVYALVRRRRTAMMAFVVAFSLLFAYKASGMMALLLLAKAVADYWLSVAMVRSRGRGMRRGVLALSVALSVGMLVYFKYAGFLAASVAGLVGGNFQLPDLVVPVGISFFTFRSLSYAVDVYRGIVVAPRRMLDYVFYLTYFPVITAGPIVRASEFFPQLEGTRSVTLPTLYSGLQLMMKGMLKKAVFADYLAQFNNLVFDNPSGYNGVETLLAVVGYSAQIYLDFSGYSDLSIGLSRTLGIELPQNFCSPYKSVSITDFWRRWHISLSSWLRDYLYIPLGGNRRGPWRTRLNLMLTMTVGGIWHGAGITFLVWGIAHGLALVVQKAVGRLLPAFRGDRWAYAAATFLFVTLAWLPFRCHSVDDCWKMLTRIFTDFNLLFLPAFCRERLLWMVMLVVAYALIYLPDRFSAWAERRFVASRWIVKLLILCLLSQLVLEMDSADVAPFIYAGF